MHELSVTESILDIATKHGQQAGATRVTDIHLVIGQLASIVDDSVQFYWDIISQDSICAAAKLHFKRIPALLECQD
jgi:hydrogenase nickel incorporation protein HypA/HybF